MSISRSFLLLSLALATPIAVASAQTSAPVQAPASAMPQVPTTKVMAIGRLTPGTTRDKIMPVMRQEVPDTLRLYLAGKLDQMYTRTDKNGVVFILNVTSVEEAHAILEKLPLGVAGMMEFELIPLGPLSPLTMLLPKTDAAK